VSDAPRIAFCGLRHPHSDAHLRTLSHSAQVSEVVVFDEDPEAVARAESTYAKVVGGHCELDALLAEACPITVACLTNDVNPDLCLKLVAAGSHVISEKPIGPTSESVREVVQAAEAHSRVLGVMYQNRYHPITQEARRLILAGALGQVVSCEARMVTSQVRFRDPTHWLFNRSVSGGGILSWLGCHYLDLLRYLLGDEVASVSAMVGRMSGEAIDVEDVASMSLRFVGGAIGSLQAGYQLPISGAGYMGPSYDSYISIRGSQGHLIWRPSNQPARLEFTSVASGWETAPVKTIDFVIAENDAYGGVYGVAFVDGFIGSALAGAEPPASGIDALEVGKVVEAAYRSSEERRHVDIARE
jgi:predicted dehydrogenase